MRGVVSKETVVIRRWEKLVEHQEILSLMIVSFILITCMVD